MTVPDRLDRTAWHLERAAIHASGELWIDDLPVGRFLDSPSIFPLPSHPGGVLSIAIRVRNTVANRYHEAMSFGSDAPFPTTVT